MKKNYEMFYNEIKFAKIFNEYFVNIIKNLGILTKKEIGTFTENNLSGAKIVFKKIQKTP